MARPPRVLRPDAWYHVTTRGIERKAIYHDDRDRRHFCELFQPWIERFGVVLHAYVLMDNHYHLLVETPRANLSQAMQWFNLSYTAWFNRRHQRCGHLFQGRFKAIIFDPSESALVLSRYIHLNPVRIQALGLDKAAQKTQRQSGSQAPRTQLVRERIQRLRAYPWSSYGAYATFEPVPSWLQCKRVLEFLGQGPGNRKEAYRRYVEDALREGMTDSPWDELIEQVALGSKQFIASLRNCWQGDERETPGLARLNGLPDWNSVLRVVENLRGESWQQFRDRHKDWGRDLALYLGQRRCGMKLKELGTRAGGLDYGTVSVAIRRLERRAIRDKSIRKLLNEALRQLSNV